MGLPDGEEIMTLALFVLTMMDGQTDRWTDRQTRWDPYYGTRASMVLRG